MFEELTPREIEMCENFVKFKGVKNCSIFIAKEMNIGITTIKTYLTNVYQKLLVDGQTQLMYILLINYSQLANCKKDYWSYYKNVKKKRGNKNE